MSLTIEKTTVNAVTRLAEGFLSRKKQAFSIHDNVLNRLGGWTGFSMACDMVAAGMPLDTLRNFDIQGDIIYMIEDIDKFLQMYATQKSALLELDVLEWLTELAGEHMTAEQVKLAADGMDDPFGGNRKLWGKIKKNTLNNSPTYNGFLPTVALGHLLLMSVLTETMMLINTEHKEALYS